MVRHTTSTGASIRTSRSITRSAISFRSLPMRVGGCRRLRVPPRGVACRSSLTPGLELQPTVACHGRMCNQYLQLVHRAPVPRCATCCCISEPPYATIDCTSSRRKTCRLFFVLKGPASVCRRVRRSPHLLHHHISSENPFAE